MPALERLLAESNWQPPDEPGASFGTVSVWSDVDAARCVLQPKLPRCLFAQVNDLSKSGHVIVALTHQQVRSNIQGLEIDIAVRKNHVFLLRPGRLFSRFEAALPVERSV